MAAATGALGRVGRAGGCPGGAAGPAHVRGRGHGPGARRRQGRGPTVGQRCQGRSRPWSCPRRGGAVGWRRAQPSPSPSMPPRQRRGPSRMAWFGLAAAAVIVIAALGAWNVSLQRQVSDAQGQVASLQQAVDRHRAADRPSSRRPAMPRSPASRARITDTQAQLTAAIAASQHVRRPGRPASRHSSRTMKVQVASYQQQIASADDRVALIGQAVGAATAAGSNVATLASTSPAGGSAAGMAIFPASGTGYIMVEGLPELGADQTYQAWYVAGGAQTSAGARDPGTARPGHRGWPRSRSPARTPSR